MAIPKIIHQTFATRELLPELAENVERLAQMNLGWEYRFYDDDDCEAFIESEFAPRYLEAYRRINPVFGAARADLFRYLLIYKVGGVYLDIKSSTTRPLDEVLLETDRYVLSYWPTWESGPFSGWGLHRDLRPLTGLSGEFQNWHVIAEPAHPFLRAAIDHVMDNIASYDPTRAGEGRMAILRTTGPIAYTTAIAPLLETAPHRLFKSHRDLGLQYSVYDHLGSYAHKRVMKMTDTVGPAAPLLSVELEELEEPDQEEA